ncbi:MAG: helix-turn-helix domain-containing protein [Halobacteriota archaeon]
MTDLDDDVHATNDAGIGAPDTREHRRLYVEIEVSMDEGCPVYGLPDSVAETRVFLGPDGRCQCDILHEDGADCAPLHVSRPVESSCACSIFAAHGCVPTIDSTSDDRSKISTYLPDRSVLSDLIADLRAHSRNASLLRIVDCDRDDNGRGITFDLTDLTTTQRDTLELAVTEGYYDEPKGISLEELADELNISKSGVSRRLSSIEATILTTIISD